VRREDGRSARLKSQGAEIASAEMSDVERVVDVPDDVQRAYYCPPIDPYTIQGAVVFAIAAKDIARVAAAVLMDPARHAGKSYRPTGPDLLGAEEMAQAIGRAVRRSVKAIPTRLGCL
jgi:uncharacterized protein YbjT (DUF2867 family)